MTYITLLRQARNQFFKSTFFSKQDYIFTFNTIVLHSNIVFSCIIFKSSEISFVSNFILVCTSEIAICIKYHRMKKRHKIKSAHLRMRNVKANKNERRNVNEVECLRETGLPVLSERRHHHWEVQNRRELSTLDHCTSWASRIKRGMSHIHLWDDWWGTLKTDNRRWLNSR